MTTDDDGSFAFVCPVCDEQLEVNYSMKEAMVESGCVICQSTVTTAAFDHELLSDLS